MKEKLSKIFKEKYGVEPTHYFENGGRFELLGNHTDHNHGFTLSAACDLTICAVASKRDDNKVNLISKGFKEEFISLDNLNPNSNDGAICFVRGVAAYLKKSGNKIGGFNVYIESNVPPGAGVSSSAAFEILVGHIFSELYNEGKLDALYLAKAGQFAENNYFGKKSGLLDQISVAFGGVSHIDFGVITEPKVYNLSSDVFKGYQFVIVDTGKSHADLSDLYSSIPNNMKVASRAIGVEYLRDTTLDALEANKDKMPKEAYEAGLHFFNENIRAKEGYKALMNNDIQTFLKMMNGSMESSTNLLHNAMVYDEYHNSLKEACDLAMKAMDNKGGAKLNGGGFAGSIITIVPLDVLDKYLKVMKERYGEDHVFIVNVRDEK